MPMTPENFFYGFVCEDYHDWQNDRASIRLAFHVAVSAFHLAEHYHSYHTKKLTAFKAKYEKLENFQDALIARQPEFKVIQDVANTFKHLYPRARCSISSGGSLESVTFNGQEMVEGWDEQIGADINIRHKDGSETRFSTAIDAVYKMWTEIMTQPDPLMV